MDKHIDLRGLTCPEPVLKTKALLDDQSVLRIDALVDGEVNVNNLSRLARSLRLQMRCEKQDDHFKVTLERAGDTSGQKTGAQASQPGSSAIDGAGKVSTGEIAEDQHRPQQQRANQKVHQIDSQRDNATDIQGDIGKRKDEIGTVIFLSKDKFGDGDPEFSSTLVSLFLQTALASGHKPRAILLANSGVRLMAKQSSSSKVLNDFKAAGVEVLACGLCVDYYKLKDEISAEQITNMFAICEYMFAADKIVSP